MLNVNKKFSENSLTIFGDVLKFFREYNEAFSKGLVPKLGDKLENIFKSLFDIYRSHLRALMESLRVIVAKLKARENS